jgi:hypothetical protein
MAGMSKKKYRRGTAEDRGEKRILNIQQGTRKDEVIDDGEQRAKDGGRKMNNEYPTRNKEG